MEAISGTWVLEQLGAGVAKGVLGNSPPHTLGLGAEVEEQKFLPPPSGPLIWAGKALGMMLLPHPAFPPSGWTVAKGFEGRVFALSSSCWELTAYQLDGAKVW